MEKTLLKKLKEGRTVFGTCIVSPAPAWSVVAKNNQLDFVFIDTEHISLDRMEVTAMCQVYRALGIAPIVRIPSPDPFSACTMMDAGAEGVVAPYLENRSQVTDLVGAIKYRPLKGERLKKILEQPETIDPVLKKYIGERNAGNLCIANIESIPALQRLDDLLSVPGLDAVFIGPHDLSISLDLPEMYDHPVFEEAVKTIIRKCRVKNIAVGIHFSESPARQVKWVKEGANIVIHSSDIALFSQRLNDDLSIIRKETGEEMKMTAEQKITI